MITKTIAEIVKEGYNSRNDVRLFTADRWELVGNIETTSYPRYPYRIHLAVANESEVTRGDYFLHVLFTEDPQQHSFSIRKIQVEQRGHLLTHIPHPKFVYEGDEVQIYFEGSDVVNSEWYFVHSINQDDNGVYLMLWNASHPDNFKVHATRIYTVKDVTHE